MSTVRINKFKNNVKDNTTFEKLIRFILITIVKFDIVAIATKTGFMVSRPRDSMAPDRTDIIIQ